MIGLTESLSGRPAEGLLATSRALEVFRTFGDRPAIAAMLDQKADLLDTLGREEEALSALAEALELWAPLGERDLAMRILTVACSILTRRWPSVALHFQQEALAQAEDSQDLMVVAQALIATAEPGFAADQDQRALEALAELRRRTSAAASAISLPRSPRSWRDHTTAAPIPGARCLSLSDAIARFETSGDRYRLIETRLARGRALAALHELDRAVADLTTALREVDERSRSLATGEPRGAYLNQMRSVHEELARIEVLGRARVEAGLEIAERGRARVFRDAYRSRLGDAAPAGGNPGGSVASELAARLPAGVCLTTFMAQPDRTFAWVVAHGRLRFFDLPVGEEKTATDARLLVEAVGKRDATADIEQRLHDLYAQLFRPLASTLAGCRRLVVVPAANMETLPFAALFDRERGRYLADEAVVLTAPVSAGCSTPAA